jgi:phenylpropionate dioxygenase-like ring-hydroxylating dioxygenase large terminal subunit
MSLQDYWYIACESGELSALPLPRTLFDRHLVLYRDGTGKPAALLDRCAHRNMALSLGKVVEGCLECPYHGWRYNAEGQCKTVPSLGPEGAIPSSIHVQAFRCVEQDGYVWVFCGENEATRLPFSFPNVSAPEWTTFRMKTRFEASVESCLENFLDCPHTVFVHKGWFRNPDARALTALVRRLADSVEVEFKNEPTSDSVIARLLYPKDQPLKHTDRFIMPNLSRVDYDFGPKHHFIITSQCTPISEMETEVYTVMTYRYGAWGSLIRLFFEPMSRHIIKQDVEILAAQTRQLGLFGGAKFSHVETDLLGLHIQSMRRQADRQASNGANAPEAETSERKITIRF